MIKLQAQINRAHHELRLRRDGQLVSAAVDGRAYDLEVHNSAAGEFLIRRGSQVYRCRVEKRGHQAEAFNVNLRGREYAVQLIDPKRLRGQQTSGAHDHGSAQIIAAMPGKVVRLLVEVGAQVEAGAGIVVVEAMKMQNEMKSPKAGVVTNLNAVEGATVNAGDVLAEIE
jgi:biotin carboxyl carrier protein